MLCQRCNSQLEPEEDEVCGSCDLLYSCPECGVYYASSDDYNPSEHYACEACLRALYHKHPDVAKSTAAASMAIYESAARVTILGMLIPTWFRFLRELHATIYRALARYIMDEELDMINDKNT